MCFLDEVWVYHGWKYFACAMFCRADHVHFVWVLANAVQLVQLAEEFSGFNFVVLEEIVEIVVNSSVGAGGQAR